MADRLAALVHDSSMDATKTVKAVYGAFVIVRRWIQRFIPTMNHKYVERNDGHANHRQPIFVPALYRRRNSALKETHRRNQTSTSEDQTPQNWACSSEKGRHTERRRVTTIFHPPVKFTEAGASSDIQKYKAHRGKNASNQLCISEPPTTENAEIYSSANPPPPTHDRRKPDAVLQRKGLKA